LRQSFLGTLITPISLALYFCTPYSDYRAILIACWPAILSKVLKTMNLTQKDRNII